MPPTNKPSRPRTAATQRPRPAGQNGRPPTQQPRPPEPLSDAELLHLQSLLDAVPAPLEPLDVSMLDGYLAAVLLQPKPVPMAEWAPPLLDAEGRQPPPGWSGDALFALVRRRHRELNLAIVQRQWFDPWVFELDEDASPSDTVLPWVAGFSLGCELFPQLMALEAAALLEPLASLYLHLDPDDLEDADALLEEIETLEPPQDLTEAVESLVRSTLMLADVSRPVAAPVQPARTMRSTKASTRRR